MHRLVQRTIPAVAGLWMLAGCAVAAPTEGPEGEPLVRGPVETIDHRATASGLLVRAAEGSVEMCGIAATVDDETRFFTRGANGRLLPAVIAEVAEGDTVEVYVNGPVAESCPVQGRASSIVILE